MFATRRARGSSLLAVLTIVAALAGIAIMMATTSASVNREARLRLESTKAFYIAEGGLDLALSQLAREPYWAARESGRFTTVDGDGTFQSTMLPLGSSGGSYQLAVSYRRVQRVPFSWTQPGLPAGFQREGRVVFTNRATSTPMFDLIAVRVTATYGSVTRAIRANVRWRFESFGAAVVTDVIAVSDTGNGVNLAKAGRNIVVDGKNQHIYGGILANCGVYVDHSTAPLTTDNASTELTSYSGPVDAHLAATPGEIEDFTTPGAPQQLFDFDRFRAAAAAGAGETFGDLSSFATAMNAANTAGTPLEGIVVVTVNAAVEGPRPRLSESGGIAIPGGINVRGTLLFYFENVPNDRFKLRIETPLSVNAATLPDTFDPTDPATFRSGYPPAIDPSRDPRGYNIGNASIENFGVDDDMPALLWNDGILDIHDGLNISGAIYSPGYVEIENKRQALQFINGTILSGGGVCLAGQSANAAGPQVIVFDRRTIDNLPTFGDQGKRPIIDGFTVEH